MTFGQTQKSIVKGCTILDADGDGFWNNGEVPDLSGAGTIYIDLNNNGVLDAEEPRAYQYQQAFTFSGLDNGVYTIRQIARPGYRLTAGRDGFVVTVSGPTRITDTLWFCHLPKTVPVIAWDVPGTIAYGTALGAEQLNATSDTAGTFSYDPPASSVLSAGTHTLRATFTPTDTEYYATVTKSVSLIVKGAPTDLELTPASIDENWPVGPATVGTGVVGRFTTVDPDAGSTSFDYQLVTGEGDADNGDFVISGNELRQLHPFDFESKSSYTIRARVTDAGGLTFEKPFNISVNDVNEAPTGLIVSPAKVLKTWPAGTTVGTLAATDPDADDSFRYTLVSGEGADDNARFRIEGNQLKTADSFDYETRTSYSIRVRTTDCRRSFVREGIRDSRRQSGVDFGRRPGGGDPSGSEQAYRRHHQRRYGIADEPECGLREYRGPDGFAVGS